MDLWKACAVKQPVDMVIFDWNFNMMASQLLQADYHLKTNPKCSLVVGVTDLRFPFEVPLIGKFTDFLIYLFNIPKCWIFHQVLGTL